MKRVSLGTRPTEALASSSTRHSMQDLAGRSPSAGASPLTATFAAPCLSLLVTSLTEWALGDGLGRQDGKAEAP